MAPVHLCVCQNSGCELNSSFAMAKLGVPPFRNLGSNTKEDQDCRDKIAEYENKAPKPLFKPLK